MRQSCLLSLVLLAVHTNLFAVQNLYCPANHSYIKVGMSQAEIVSACGDPVKKETPNRPATQKIPVKQLFYNMAGSPTAFFGVYNIPVGTQSGADVEVDVVNDKVRSIRLNSTGVNALSLCDGGGFTTGDHISKVYNACGNPSLINETHIKQPVQGTHEVWTYQADPYSGKTVSLTFVGGKLQSINH